MHFFLNIYLRRREILLIFFRHFVELPAKNQPLLDYFWDISRDWETAKNDNSAWEIVEWRDTSNFNAYTTVWKTALLTNIV